MKNMIDIINKIMHIDQSLTGMDYLQVLIKNIATTLDVKYAFIGHAVGNCCNQIQTDVVWAGDDYYENFTYDLKDTPCEIVFTGKRVCIHAEKVAETFKKDLLLKEMGVEGYVGAPVVNDKGRATGLLVLLDDKPMHDTEFLKSITEFLALRASNEIEKYRIEENLVRQVAERTLELEQANEEIELINKNLEKRVEEEISKNEEKQRIITEQSKIAIMSELIENVAHQWKEPLSTIEAYSSGVRLKKEMDSLDDEFLMESMDGISHSSELLSQTINDFKDFFKVNKKQEVFSLKSVIDRTLKLMGTRLKNSSIEVFSQVNNTEIKGFTNEVIQVVLNVLSNAYDELIKYPEQRKLIFIEMSSDEKYILLKIRDNAHGIPEHLLDRLFNPYISTKKETGSSGIGLYMSKDMIEKHMGGKLEVQNVTYDYEGETYTGAEFTVKLIK